MDFIFLIVHRGYVAFRTSDNRTGSNPGTLADNIGYFVTHICPGVENIQIRYEDDV